jgi:type IV secretion system protein VirB10
MTPYVSSVPPYVGAEPYRTPQRQSSSDRRLSGVAFARESEQAASPSAMTNQRESGTTTIPASWAALGQPASGLRPDEGVARSEEGLAKLLRPRVTTAARAQIVPTQQFLLPKGAFIDCTLETAIDSTLPGMTTCVTATDTFGVDGKVVLLERGSKLVGETRGEVQNGAARVFVLWTEARTPTGVVVPLESPGTDALGRSGLPGEVNRHFWDRFGAAMLISMINGAMQVAVQSSTRGGGAIIYNPATSQEALTDVLKGTINIAPTITKQQGDRIQILVARDLDFRTVYELRTSSF